MEDRPIYAAIGGEQVSGARFRTIQADLQSFIDAVRGRIHHRNGPHDRNPGQPPATNNTLLTSERMVHESGMVRINGRPAIASVMRIVPFTDTVHVQPGREHLIISVQFLDRKFLKNLASLNLIDAPRFSMSPVKRKGEEVLPVTSHRGEPIGYFFWHPDLPGSMLMRQTGVLTIFTVLLTIASMALLARWLWRATSELQSTLIELQASEAQAQHLAFHDVLTGLPNRALFNDRLKQALARARRGERVAVLALDLDRFKQVNDTLGHHAGDALICEVAECLLGLVREGDTVARLGGDEFAVILSDCNPEQVEAICERILAAVREPFSLLGHQAFVGVSIGVVNVTVDATDRVDVLRKADIALYRAKAEGRDNFCVFTEEMDESVRLRGAIEADLRDALASGTGLEVHYQPQVGGEGYRVVGLEALVRWRHPTRGMIAPGQFIPIAEETGLISDLGEWVLREACVAAKRWPNLFIAVNLSPVQFRVAGFAERLIGIVRESGVNPSQIELEVTESIFLNGDDYIRRALAMLRASGMRIALDDFGTGYSSLGYLRQFKIDKIKIDRSFVQNADQNADSVAIVAAVANLGQAMGITVVAEGVETPEQQRFLSAAGCNGMQGYLFSRPVPGDELALLPGLA